MGPEPELKKQHAEPVQKPSPGEKHRPEREPPAPTAQQAGNQALQTLLRPKKEAPKATPEEKPPGEVPAKKIQPIQSAEWESMSRAGRKAYLDQWMKENGVTRIIKTNDHHAWPKYLAGPESGPLIPIDEQLHRAFHSGLNKVLPGFEGTGHYAALTPLEKSNAIRTLMEYTAQLDQYYKTKISQVLARALEGGTY